MKLKPPLPREHGAWAMLATPLLLGALLAPVSSSRVLWLFIAALSFFLLRHPVAILVKRWANPPKDAAYLRQWVVIYGGVAALSGAWLLLGYGLWWLIPAALVGATLLGLNMWLVTRRQEMSLMAELSGIFGLAMGAPMSYYVASGLLDRLAMMLWLLNFLYFGGTVFYVKLKVRIQPRLPAPTNLTDYLHPAAAALAYQTITFIIIIGLTVIGLLPMWAWLIFLPATLKLLWGITHWQDKKALNLPRLGAIEVIHTVIFALLVWGVL